MSNETTFENAQVGDRVWSSKWGWGEVLVITKRFTYPIEVRFSDTCSEYHTLKGVNVEGEMQSLFWDELTIPTRPKRKVTKTIEAWANVYPDGKYYVYETLGWAERNKADTRIALAHLTGTYEVEE